MEAPNLFCIGILRQLRAVKFELWTFAGSSILFILVWELWDCHARSLYLTQQLADFVARRSVFLLTSRRDTCTDRHVKTRPVELRCLLALYFGKFISTSVWHFRVLNYREDYCNYEIVIKMLPVSISKSFVLAPVLWYYEHRKAEKMRICATLRFLEMQMKLLTKTGSRHRYLWICTRLLERKCRELSVVQTKSAVFLCFKLPAAPL